MRNGTNTIKLWKNGFWSITHLIIIKHRYGVNIQDIFVTQNGFISGCIDLFARLTVLLTLIECLYALVLVKTARKQIDFSLF